MLVFLLLAIPFRVDEQFVKMPKIEYPIILQGNSLIAPKILSQTDKKAVLSVFYDENGLDLDPLIKCLIKHESNGNPNAIGDNGKAFGVLQFHLPTFEYFKHRYGLDYLQYEDPQDQILLANLIIGEDFNNVKHWTTYKFCK